MEVVGRPYNGYNPKQVRLDLGSMTLDILLRYLIVFNDSNELQGTNILQWCFFLVVLNEISKESIKLPAIVLS
jgi:hypothetical protein